MTRDVGRTTAGGRLADLLAKKWKLLALRGLAAVVFGALAFTWPTMTLLALVYLFGAYALVNGLLALFIAKSAPIAFPPFRSLIFESIFSILAGISAFLLPGLTAMALLILIAAWAIVTGLIEITAALKLRTVFRHEWLLVIAGAGSTLFGILLLLQPTAGALAVVLWIGLFSITFGILLMVLAFRLRRRPTLWRTGTFRI